MNTKLIEKENSFSISKTHIETSNNNENNIFLASFSNKETNILKFKHLFFSIKEKINNYSNLITNSHTNLIEMHQVTQYMLSHRKGR